MKKLFVKMVGVAMMILSTSLSAAEFFVSPNGSDSNPGSKVKPFATLEKARDAKQNLVTDSDPGFRDLEALDFSFKDLAEIQKQLPEFKPIPSEKIGLQRGR